MWTGLRSADGPNCVITPPVDTRPRRRSWLAWVIVGSLLVLIIGAVLVLQRGVSWRDQVPVVEAVLNSPQEVALTVGTCGARPELDALTESDERVEVSVISTRTIGGPGGNDCQDQVDVQLREPLGDRPIVDRTSGEEVSVRGR